jgi:DNA-binding transcriptional MerR regulator
MDKGYRTKQLAEWLGLSEVTVRQWTTGEWRPYLSAHAHGGGGRRRYFLEQDARILAFVAALKEQGETRDTIHTTLKRLQAEDWKDLPPMPPAPPSMGPIQMMPRETADTALSTQRAALMREIALLQDRVVGLESQLSTEREHSAELETELRTAREQVGELRGRLATMETERLPVRTTLQIVILAAILAVAVIVVIVLTTRAP